MPDDNIFTQMFKDADDAFNGKYKDQLNALHGLSKVDVDAITPDTEDMRTYAALIKVVEHASKNNLAQAKLASNIRGLGNIAISIARKVPALAALI